MAPLAPGVGVAVVVLYPHAKARALAEAANRDVGHAHHVEQAGPPDVVELAALGEKLDALLEDDLRWIFGDGFRDAVPFVNPKCRDFRPYSSPYAWRGKREVYTREAYLSYWITQLLYAKRGKLRTLHDPFGLNVSVGNPEINIRMCEAIQRNLRDNGADVHLEVELEPGIADRSRKYLRSRVRARETQHRYWEGEPLDAIRELRPRGTNIL